MQRVRAAVAVHLLIRSMILWLQARWTSLALPARLVVLVWLATLVFGVYELLLIGHWNVVDAQLQPRELRLKAWGPVYEFARACVSRVPSQASILLLDPTDRLTGATNYALAPDVDLDDVRAFEYVMYPRGITGLGLVTTSWTPADGGADYVALWAPAENRSATAVAQVQQAESTLRASASGPLCTYQNPLGNRGAIFAVSGLDAAPPAVAVQSAEVVPESWPTYASALAGLASLWCIGVLILHVLTAAGWSVRSALACSLAFPLGCLAVTLELLLASLLGMSWQFGWLALPWCALGLHALFTRARGSGRDVARLVRAIATRRVHQLLKTTEWVAAAGLVALALGVALASVANLPQSDGFHFAYFQAHAFFVDRGITPYYARSAELVFTANAHPPLVALSITWLYLAMGSVHEQPTLLLWPAMWISLVGGFSVFARTALTRRAALCCTLMFAIITYDLSTAAFGRAADAPNRAGFADLPLATFVFLAAGLLWSSAPHTRQSLRVPAVAALLLVGAGLTKEEGSLMALLTIAALPLLNIPQLGGDWRAYGRTSWKSIAAAGLVFAFGILPWVYVRVHYAIPEMIVQANRSPIVLLQALPVSVGGVFIRMVPRWILPASVLGAAWVVGRRHMPPASLRLGTGRTCFLLAITGAQLAADIAALTLGPNEIHVELVQGAQRLLLQLVPLPFLAALDFLPVLFGWGPASVRASASAQDLRHQRSLPQAAQGACILGAQDR